LWACSHSRPHCSGCPYPTPHLKGAGFSAAQEDTRELCSKDAQGSLQDTEATSAKLLRKECREMQAGPKAKLLAPQILILRSDCHLPAMDWADKRFRSQTRGFASRLDLLSSPTPVLTAAVFACCVAHLADTSQERRLSQVRRS